MTDGSTLHIKGMTMLPHNETMKSSQCYKDFECAIPAKKYLGYGDDAPTAVLPTVKDLGYDDDDVSVSIHDLGYGEEPAAQKGNICGSSRVLQGAIRIRNGKRILPTPRLGGNSYNSSTSSGSFCIEGSESFNDSSVDYSDEDDDPEEYMEDLTELTIDGGYDQDTADDANPHMPSQVNMEFRGNASTPRRISLAYSQHTDHTDGTTSVRTGSLEVSIGTSRLPRRRASMDGSCNRSNDEQTEIIRGLKTNHSNLTVSTRPMRRLSIEDSCHSKNHGGHTLSTRPFRRPSNEAPCPSPTASPPSSRPARRITMNLSSRPSRRASVGMTSEESYSTKAPPSQTLSSSSDHRISTARRSPPTRRVTMSLSAGACRRGSLTTSAECGMQVSGRTSSTVHRRQTMEYSTPTVPLSTQATRRISMDMSPASPAGLHRRISMNLCKSLLPRTTPPAPTKTRNRRRTSTCVARSA